uniref:Glutathione S-transferase 1-like n=1 Tax=Crassostrea virginica TaxID=6565 RepID=A0A8B8BIK0_CRAVI|nr:glutathione S-transferase 1-like [Crassostrea virginica]XP_022302655.1 glutathione S-transferase 1-like [Crassostrea virginica]XP_022302656.1 glutathione S-transferase 1-like [Crassostrea virginica]
MGTYRLYYFDLRGRAEILRMLFRLAQVEFEDIQVKQSDWGRVKHDTPTGELPYLEVGDKLLTQSLTIARYLAREFGLAGGSSWQTALVDQVVDSCDDLRAENAKIIHERDKDQVEALKSKMKDVILPRHLDRLTTFLLCHGDKYFVGSEITLADVAVHEVLTTFLQNDPSTLDGFQILRDHRKLVEQHPHLRDYLANRPYYVV